MSTPSGRPVRPASVFDYAPKRVREQWDRGETSEAAARDSADDPAIRGDNDRAPAEHEDDTERRVLPLMPRGAHEDAHRDVDHGEDEPAQDWEGDDPQPDAAGERRTEDWLDELEYRAERRERRAKAAEIDREYEDQLERLAASLRTLRDEDDNEDDEEDEHEPERPLAGEPQRGRSSHPADPAERDLFIDGVRLPRFLQASYVPPRSGGSRSGWLGFVLAGVITIGVGAPLSYYFYAVTSPLTTKPRETKSDLQYTIASVTERLPKLDERVADVPVAPALAPPARAAEPAAQAAPKPAAAPAPPAAPTQPAQSVEAPRRVPLTHVVRWPDQAQASAVAEPPQAPSAGPSAQWPRPAPAPAAAPDAGATSLAYAPPPAPALRPSPPPPPSAPPRAPTGDMDEVQLMLKQGQDFVAAGDLATARVVLRRAAQAGAAAAAFTLAQTYDPAVLAKMRARGVEPDLAEARRWYEMAQKLGSAEAAQQLERLARDD